MVMLSLQQTNIYVAYFLYCCVSYVDRLPLGSIAFIWIGGYQLVSILMILICTVLLLCKLTIIVTAKPSFVFLQRTSIYGVYNSWKSPRI